MVKQGERQTLDEKTEQRDNDTLKRRDDNYAPTNNGNGAEKKKESTQVMLTDWMASIAVIQQQKMCK